MIGGTVTNNKEACSNKSLTVTVLLVFVSGVPMLERKYVGNPNYEAYKQHTWPIIPKFW
jgi:steroid 5-alpha reductase family enzyme